MIKRFFNRFLNSDRDFKERMFVLMTEIALSALALILIGDLIVGENIIEIVGLGVMIIFATLITILAVRFRKVNIGAIIIATGIVFGILPIAFFFGGGLNGGAIIWFSFSYLYIGLILAGMPRKIMMLLLSIVIVIEYCVAYYMPQLVVGHDRKMWFIDSGIAVILVGFVVYIMVWFQNKMYERESMKVMDQAKEIEELNKSQNRFFSSMSHEIRTPINTIIGLNEMILRENASEEINENASNIQAASNMLLHLINDILDMSKFESGQMEITEVPYHTGDMLSNVVGMLWLKAKEKNLDFTVDVSPELPESLIGDEVRIEQILINVLNNAIKYTREGSVRLQIQSVITGDVANVVYTVSDTGMGIKKESIPYLFTAFKRVDEDKNRYIEGTGLGLSIVKQLVDLMGGKISVNSVYTKGSTFIIEIPQKIANKEQIGEIDVKRKHMSRHGEYVKSFEAPDAKVLVVDDTQSNIMVVQKLLRETKVQVDTATSGKEALQKTFDNEYNVIFMDHMMPEMDGIQCLHRIKMQNGGLCHDSKVIALTANAGSEMETLYANEGFEGYLLKPINGKALEAELYRLLPKNLVVVTGTDESLAEESMSWIRQHQKKMPIAVTTESVADLPHELIEEFKIQVIPHMVKTSKGVFRDGVEIQTRGLLAYMDSVSEDIDTMAPDVVEHETFFSEQLERANNVIHISISSRVEHSGCITAWEAARDFDNVFIVDSGHLSSGQGLLAIEASRLAAEGRSVDEIVSCLNRMKSHIHTSFIVDSLDYLARARQMSPRIATICKALMIHPVLALKRGKMTLDRVFMGSREKAWESYVSSSLRVPGQIDRRMLFVTYVGMSQSELLLVEEMIKKRISFDRVYFKEASPAIAVNSGPGTFGLLFFTAY